MTPEEEQYYAELFDMFASPGWQHYMDYVKGVNQSAKNNWDAEGESLLINKGIVFETTQILNFQSNHEQVYNHLKGDDNA